MIFGIVQGAIELVLTGGIGLFGYQEYKHGFPITKGLVKKVNATMRRMTGIRETEADKAQAALDEANISVKEFGKQVALLQDSLAGIKADRDMAHKRYKEQLVITGQFREVLDEAVGKNEDAAAAAANSIIQAERRAQLFKENFEEFGKVAEVLEVELEGVEMDFDVLRNQAETVRVNAEITIARQNLHALTSSIEVNTGLTNKGALEQALISSEHGRIKTEYLLDMSTRHAATKVRRFTESIEVKKMIDEAKKRVAEFPAVSTPLGLGGLTQADTEVSSDGTKEQTGVESDVVFGESVDIIVPGRSQFQHKRQESFTDAELV